MTVRRYLNLNIADQLCQWVEPAFFLFSSIFFFCFFFFPPFFSIRGSADIAPFFLASSATFAVSAVRNRDFYPPMTISTFFFWISYFWRFRFRITRYLWLRFDSAKPRFRPVFASFPAFFQRISIFFVIFSGLKEIPDSAVYERARFCVVRWFPAPFTSERIFSKKQASAGRFGFFPSIHRSATSGKICPWL